LSTTDQTKSREGGRGKKKNGVWDVEYIILSIYLVLFDLLFVKITLESGCSQAAKNYVFIVKIDCGLKEEKQNFSEIKK